MTMPPSPPPPPMLWARMPNERSPVVAMAPRLVTSTAWPDEPLPPLPPTLTARLLEALDAAPPAWKASRAE